MSGATISNDDDATSGLVVALDVRDISAYQQYRQDIGPLLRAAGGRFRYDFRVTEVLQAEAAARINRVFVLEFPDRARRAAFFADGRYQEIKRRLFTPAVSDVIVVADYNA